MIFDDITKDLQGGENMGGIAMRVYYGLYEDVLKWPDKPAGSSSLEALGALTGNIEMKPGKFMYVIHITDDTGEFNIEPVGELDGKSYVSHLKFFSPGLQKKLLGFMNATKNRDMFFVVPDNNGQMFVMGDALRAATYMGAPDGSGTGKETAGRRGASFEYVYKSSNVYVYNGELSTADLINERPFFTATTTEAGTVDISIRGTAGKQVSILIGSSVQNVVFTGQFQELEIPVKVGENLVRIRYDLSEVNYLNLSDNASVTAFNALPFTGLRELNICCCTLTTAAVDAILTAFTETEELHLIESIDLSGQVPVAPPSTMVKEAFVMALPAVLLNVDGAPFFLKVLIPEDNYNLELAFLGTVAAEVIIDYGDDTGGNISLSANSKIQHTYEFAGLYLIRLYANQQYVEELSNTNEVAAVTDIDVTGLTALSSVFLLGSNISNERLANLVTALQSTQNFPYLTLLNISFQANSQGITQAVADAFIAARPAVQFVYDTI